MAKRGPKVNSYVTSWGQTIPDLVQEVDGRWRVASLPGRIRFTEPDERRAIERFHQLTGPDPDLEKIRDILGGWLPSDPEHWAFFALNGIAARARRAASEGRSPFDPVYAYIAEQIITNPKAAAKRLGIEEIGYLRDLRPPATITLRELLDLYRNASDAKPQARAETTKAFEHLMNHTGALALEDLTTERLIAFRDHVRAKPLKPGTIAAYFARCKWIIGHGKLHGLDAGQIDAALSRMTVLRAPKDTARHNPRPVTRPQFAALLAAATGNDHWTAILLAACNCCMYLDETLGIRWDALNLDNATFVDERGKTRVIRAATLWPETVTALRSLSRTASPWVFTSKHGTRFNSKGQWKSWNKLRIKANCPNLEFNQIRDGAYTAAAQAPGVDEKYARLLAGHTSHGLQDAYVQRNPAIVAPACDAVRRHYLA